MRIADWAVLEAPDVYFYISAETAGAVAADKGALRDPARAAKLTENNLRPSNLGFAGEETWFRAPRALKMPGASTSIVTSTMSCSPGPR